MSGTPNQDGVGEGSPLEENVCVEFNLSHRKTIANKML